MDWVLVAATESMMVCSKCGDRGYFDIGEWPWSWQFSLCSCGGIIHPDIKRNRSKVIFKDGTWKWIKNFNAGLAHSVEQHSSKV